MEVVSAEPRLTFRLTKREAIALGAIVDSHIAGLEDRGVFVDQPLKLVGGVEATVQEMRAARDHFNAQYHREAFGGNEVSYPARVAAPRLTFMPTDVFADGGTIGANPSEIGGTYAWRHCSPNAREPFQESAVVYATGNEYPCPITNNQMEFLALLTCLEALPGGWHGYVWTDSGVTLGRFEKGWATEGIPQAWVHRLDSLRHRLNWKRIVWGLLDGHPTKAQLETGVGKRGHPVSPHQVWCDTECSRIAKRVLAERANGG